MSTPKTAWQGEAERGNAMLMRLMIWMANTLGRRVVHAVLPIIIFYYVLFAKKARRASFLYLRRVLRRPPRFSEQFQHFLTFAKVMVDRFYFLQGKLDGFRVDIHGDEVFDALAGRGCLLVTAHVGSFDPLRVMSQRAHTAPRLRILLDRAHNATIMTLFERYDPSLADGIIDARTPPAQLALLMNDAITAGEWVGVMADRVTDSDRTLNVTLLGDTLALPAGIWQLACLLDLPVVSCIGLFDGKQGYDLYFASISDGMGCARADRTRVIHDAAQRFADTLEPHLHATPYNWFNFYDAWNDDTSSHR